ncbi:MAG: HU family DNA-binding protein [Candidatus Azosocius agrarius]|nr:MAG: HU family DNA-binding protein [Gammaproteobacteria bacterium]
MNKADLIGVVASRTHITKAKSNHILDVLLSTIATELTKDNGVITITGFGTFSIKNRPSRLGRNPKTGEKINIDASKVPVFRPGKKLKTLVNNISC